MTSTELAGRFNAKPSGQGWAFQCPVHDDRVASVTLSDGTKGAVLHCHAGCATPDILAAVGLTVADLFDELVPVPVPVLRSSSAAATYDYRALDGTLLHQVVRGADKSFKQRQPNADGGWTWSGTGPRVPYRLPDLVGQETVWIVEGEKDADTLAAQGLAATCNRGGAGKWKAEETDALVALGTVRQVYVLPDHDAPGAKHAASVVEQLTAAGMPATVVRLPGLPDHGDVSDWCATGGTAAALWALATAPPTAAVADQVIDLLHAEQAFTRLGESRYRLDYPDLGITLEAAQLHRDRDRDLHGELTVTTTMAGAKTVDGVLLWSSMNFSSQRTRATMAQSLAGRSGAAGLDWVGAMETLSLRVARAESEGTPIQPLADYPLPSVEGTWEVSGLPILQRHPMIIFGDGGAAKSYLALHIASMLAMRGIRVLYADWEFSAEDHRDRLGRLTGAAMPTETLHYVRCASPLITEVERLQRHIVQHGIQYVICDSIAFAVPGRPEDAENASAYYRAVRYLGIGSLHLAHTTKSLEHGEDKPFGSVFWSNGARSIWHAKRSGDPVDGADTVDVALTHKKSNTGKRLAPMGVRFAFGRERTTVDRVDLATSADLVTSLPVWQRIRSAVSSGPKSVAQLSEELGERPNTLNKTIARMEMFDRDAAGRVHLSAAPREEIF